MKRPQKTSNVGKPVPLDWVDCSWTVPIKIRRSRGLPPEEFACRLSARGTLPFSPFRGFHFSQLAVQDL